MPCNPETCRTCTQIRKYREFRELLPEENREPFDEWFNEVHGDLEMAQTDLAMSKREWTSQFDDKPIGINL